jgi:hypothetical protein
VDPVPVRGALSAHRDFTGHLTITHVALDDAGYLRLTGVLHGAATDRRGATIRVGPQPFTAPASVLPSDWTTDVLLLRLAPVALASVPGRLALVPIPLDVDAVPDVGDRLVSRRPAR